MQDPANTQEGQVPKEPVTAPETPATAEPEFVIVDGEKVLVDLEEIIGQHPDGTPIRLKETDNPKSYKFFQSKDKKKDTRIKDLEQRLATFEQTVSSVVQPEKSQVPQKPKLISPIPKNFDLTDAVANPQGENGQWYYSKLKYDVEKAEYDEYWKNQLDTEREQKKQTDASTAFRNQKINEFQTKGGATSLEEAMRVYDWVTSPESGDPRDLVEFYRWKFNKQQPPKQPTAQPGKVPSPATIPSNAEPVVNPAEFTKSNDYSWMYKTK